MFKKHIIIFSVVLLLASPAEASRFKPKPTGLLNGSLHPCPQAPKCVSSFSKNKMNAIKPLIYQSTSQQARFKLLSIIKKMENAEIITASETYIHVQFKIKPFRWIDDVEFLFADDGRTINFSSSASAKFGYWDWGVNRNRMESIRQQFNN